MFSSAGEVVLDRRTGPGRIPTGVDHFGETGGVRVGAGASTSVAAGPNGTSLIAGPLLLGGNSNLVTGDGHALAAAFDLQLPLGSWTTDDGMTSSVGTARGYLGAGYRYTWSATPTYELGEKPKTERVLGSVALSLGPEAFYTTEAAAHSSFGVAADLTFTVTGWALREIANTSKNDY